MSSKVDPTEHLKVVAGNPSEEELAVVVAVLQAAAASASQTADASNSGAKQSTSRWNRNPATLRSPITPGIGQWQASYRSGLN